MDGLLQTAVEQAFNAIVVTTANLQGDGPIIIYCNPAFCVMTGYKAEELIGRSPRMLQGPLTDPKVLRRLRACLHSRQFFEGATFNYRKDGSAYLVEWNVSPVLDAHGDIRAFVSVQQNITERVQAQESQALLARALDATDDAVLIADEKANILFVNQAFEQLTGYGSAEVLGPTPAYLQSGTPPPAFHTKLREALAQGEGCKATFSDRQKHGRLYYVAQTITLLKDDSGATRHYVGVSKDVTELVMRTQELREQAYHDALTGLLNRRAGQAQLHSCQRRAQAEDNGYALILGDIDKFKQINDRFGHEAGDHILRQCATLLKAVVRSGDAVVRWGGEEFLIILPSCQLEAACELAERMRASIAAQRDAMARSITMSFGVSAWQSPEDSAAVLRRADRALYLAKKNGRDRVTALPS